MLQENIKEFEQIMLKYGFAKKRLETEVEILLQEYEFKKGYNPVEHIKSRLKTLDSASKKLQKRGYSVDVNNLCKHVHDMVGMRIVCSFLSDVYDIVDKIKTSKQFIVKDESDYIKNPKVSGYTSYHINVLVPIYLDGNTEYVEAEIQIRTVSMDCWASLDHKLRYKLPKEIPDYLETAMIDRAKEMIEHDKKMQELNDMVKNLKEETNL